MNRQLLRSVLAIVLATVIVLASPLALRHVAFFRIRQVELVGVLYNVPEQVLQSLDLGPERNLFASLADVRERALQNPGIEGVRVERRLPGTLRIVVRERLPVALVPGEVGLEVVDGQGQQLAYDPAARGFDLPLAAPDSVVLRTLEVVRVADSVLYSEVSFARRGEGEAVILELDGSRVILRGIPTAMDVAAVEVVRRHLAAAQRRFEQLDARFARKVFVQLSGA